jgi:tetratricopeptide (TPR) repeat protein
MLKQTSNIIRIGSAELVIALLCVGFFTGCGQGDKPDPDAAAKAEAKKLTVQVKGMMGSGEFDQAAETIESFLKQYPDAPDAPRFWALKIVCHRNADDLTGVLLTVAAMSENFQGRGLELCNAGDVLVEHECLQDAAKAFELAATDESVQDRACYHAASCNYRLGRFAKAMEYIDLAAALRPNDPKITTAVKRIEDARFAVDK